jgi:hypothetical protein
MDEQEDGELGFSDKSERTGIDGLIIDNREERCSYVAVLSNLAEMRTNLSSVKRDFDGSSFQRDNCRGAELIIDRFLYLANKGVPSDIYLEQIHRRERGQYMYPLVPEPTL